jgi:hypothetical protein
MRSASTKKRKRISSNHADDEDSESPVASKSTQQREMNRKEKRKSAQDMNRPRLNEKISSNDSSSSSTVIVDENDDDWLEYDDENEARTNTSAHDKSLEYLKLFEEHQKHQQKMRRKSFNNRRNSLIKLSHQNAQHSNASRVSSNDFEKFKSCLSLASDESSFGVNHSGSFHKTFTKSFVRSHIPEVTRISDIYVPQPRRLLLAEVKNESNYNWKDASKPFPLLIIVILTLGILALTFLKISHD